MRWRCIPPLGCSLVFFCVVGCSDPKSSELLDSKGSQSQTQKISQSDKVLFVERSEVWGLAQETEWPDGTYSLPEIMQGGVGLFDLEGDGDLDLVQTRVPPPGSNAKGVVPRLWKQEEGQFVELHQAGLTDAFYGQGIVIGDVNNDGLQDLYFANYGRDEFYLNQGNGQFINKTVEAGFEGEHWSVSGAFCDIDADGWLDLYVVHYVNFDRTVECTDTAGKPEYCGPQIFHGQSDRLYRNLGDGDFKDVTESAGIVMPQGGERARGLGVVCVDVTRDGLPDFYVANDAESNQLWVNQGDGTFKDEAVIRGVAVNRNGKPEASMGVAVGDVDQDGSMDLFTTHLIQEHNTLYGGTDGPLFFDRTIESGLSVDDADKTGFGCSFLDIDLDGDQDLAVANGRVKRHKPATSTALSEFWRDYAEVNLLYRNEGGSFTPWGEEAGDFTQIEDCTRGLAVGDLDQDGDLDMITSSVNNQLRIYENRLAQNSKHWLCVRPMEEERAALGSIVELHGEVTQRIPAIATDSYASSREPCAHFGVSGNGLSKKTVDITVHWSDGQQERFDQLEINQAHKLHRGSSKEQMP